MLCSVWSPFETEKITKFNIQFGRVSPILVDIENYENTKMTKKTFIKKTLCQTEMKKYQI